MAKFRILLAVGSAFICFAAIPAEAITKKQCEDAGGTFSGTVMVGLCKFKVTTAKETVPDPIKPVTADQCKGLGGSMVTKPDGSLECLVGTHGRKAGDKPAVTKTN